MSERDELQWMKYARCLDEDPELFFPVGTTGPAVEQAIRAKDVCSQCEVREQCLARALKLGRAGLQTDGIWGGRDQYELRAMIRSLIENAQNVKNQDSAAEPVSNEPAA